MKRRRRKILAANIFFRYYKVKCAIQLCLVVRNRTYIDGEMLFAHAHQQHETIAKEQQLLYNTRGKRIFLFFQLLSSLLFMFVAEK